MDLFLNELSLKEAENTASARQWMANLMVVYKSAHSQGFKGIRMPRNIASSLLAANYTVADWLNDKTVDQVVRSLFISQANYPFTEDVCLQKDDDGHRLAEFTYKENIVYGLGAACLLSSLSVSFDNDKEWDALSLPLRAAYYSEENGFTESDEHVKHCSKLNHLTQLRQWILLANKQAIPNGKLLWLKRSEFFPHLYFCPVVEAQISPFHENDPQFNQIKNRLFEMESYCRDWTSSVFVPKQFSSKVTPESETRLNQLKDQLNLLCSDRVKRLFSWHFRYTPGAGRIYFYPDSQAKRMHIGYIGPKLKN